MRLFWLYFTPILFFASGYFFGKKKNERNIPGGQREDRGESASPTSVIEKDYHVFLSFRGPDVRDGFADFLYRRLKDVGLRFHPNPNFVFRDNDELPFGGEIGANLMSAITHSKISIPIISKNYASSEWCLRELIQIMECVESGRQIVLPVLYKVETKDVKYLRGSVEDAIKSRKHWSDEMVKQRGEEALRKVAERRVYVNGRESELVDELVATVMQKQQEDFRPWPHEDSVGNEDHVVDVMRLADTAYPNTRIIGIYGIDGIGKTTLATIIYKTLFDKFKCRSCLKNVGETIKSKGIEHVQSRLISDILNFPNYQVNNSDMGIDTIQLQCTQKKVLILLDDVNDRDHLDKLIGDGKFKPGSRIIITCRDKAILKPEYYEYKCKELDFIDSSRLFNLHAFEGKRPPTELVSLSSEIVATTGGYPLTLIVIGSLLKKERDPEVWEEYRDKWRKAPQGKVLDKLKISYNALDNYSKQMFLDIACFFIGTDYRIAIYLWKDLELYPKSGLINMMNLSLIKYDDNNELRMHDQLRDLGRDLARTANKKPCSRLWDKEATRAFQNKEGIEKIKALRLDENDSIQFLHASAMDFTADLVESLSELKWLKWERCPDSFEAINVHLEKLLILDLSGGNISETWRGWSWIKMEKLKVLNLSCCSYLKRTPNLSAFESLERLVLEKCENLEEIDPSIRNATCLVSLNVRYCGSLMMLPPQLGELKELKELLVDKTNIQEIPKCIESLEKLEMLSAVGCRLLTLTRIPSSISGVVSLSTLNLNTCKKLPKLPDSIETLGNLRRLSLVCCYMLEGIPSSIGELGELVELDLSFTGIKELPKSIEKLKKLEILRISHSKIGELPSAIGKLESLQELDASGCHNLEIISDIGRLSSLKTLRLGKTKISGLPAYFDQLSALEHLDLLYCSELQSLPKPPFSLSSLQLTCGNDELPSLSDLRHLKKLTLHFCMSLLRIPELPSHLRKLRVWKCPKLERLSNLPNLKSLLELELLQCYGLKEFNGLEALTSLKTLNLSTSTELSNLNNFEDLESLRYIDLESCDGETGDLHEIQGLGQLESLEVLNVSARKHITVLDLSKSEHLKQLIVKDCEKLVEIKCHSKFLEHFDSDGCKSLTELPVVLLHDRP